MEVRAISKTNRGKSRGRRRVKGTEKKKIKNSERGVKAGKAQTTPSQFTSVEGNVQCVLAPQPQKKKEEKK